MRDTEAAALRACAWMLCALLPGWPGRAAELASIEVPVWVEYRAGEEALARATLAAAEAAWPRLFVELGHAAPWTLDAAGAEVRGMRLRLGATPMGADGAMVEWQADVPGTPACDCSATVLVDRTTSPDSALLAEGVLHELVHAGQYAVDCTEAPTVYEAFALASLFHERPDSPVVRFGLREFQRFPERPLDLFTLDMPCDGLRPCFGYVLGAGLFPLFLVDRFAGGDPAALAGLFAACGQDGQTRVGPPHPRCEPANHPDWLEGVDLWLRSRGSSFPEAFAEFACARAVAGARDDGAHFTRGGELPEPALTHVHGELPAEGTLSLFELGSGYVELPLPAPAGLRLALEADPAAGWAASVLAWRAGQAVSRQGIEVVDGRAGLELALAPGVDRLLLVLAQLHDGQHAPDDMDYSQVRRVSYRVEALASAPDGGADGTDGSDGSDGSDRSDGAAQGCSTARAGSLGLLGLLLLGVRRRRPRLG
ncbi:MAG TPA: hypothetical protein PK668_10400 [Myxococcota bacterium]|nr:hypothetical protein [Myxococcota bacterium]HRY93427.1 hypothetical protein [Myxococcota bacterium]HSA22017.1 hypothetical protein [Myxococcota bacterium]